MTVIRTWAFCDGSEWNALQPAPGEWDERVFAALDWVLAQAGARGLRAVLALTNYWEAYGGIKQYVRCGPCDLQCSKAVPVLTKSWKGMGAPSCMSGAVLPFLWDGNNHLYTRLVFVPMCLRLKF